MGFDDPIMKAIDKGGGQECDVAGVLRSLDAAGYAIVPKEPSVAMLHAGNSCCIDQCVDRHGVSKVWKAMIEAVSS